jgi:plasmid stabilization system protein ParE
MSYQIILSRIAKKELETSVDWYHECQENLGARFIEAIDDRLAALSQNPGLFPIKPSGYREVLVKKFPFLIVYKILEKEK